MNLEKFEAFVGGYSVVSFDVFDTLIERDCLLPSQIFVRAGERVMGKGNALSFCKARMVAERETRKKSVTGEVTLAEIHENLAARLGLDARQTEEVEIEEELKAVRLKPSVLPFFQWARSNKRVVLISDMYLSSSVLREMLSKCGIDGYEALFISCEYGVDKVSGRLFSVATEQLEVNVSSIVHVGDSVSADVRGAKRAGVSSVFIPRRAMLLRIFLKKLQSFRLRLCYAPDG